jgi:protein-tyrosine phosphatase
MERIYWIEEGRLAGRCGPSVAPLNLHDFKKAGFRTVLSLDGSEYKLVRGKPSGVKVRLIHLTNSIPPRPIEKAIFAVRLPEAVDHVVRSVSQNDGAVLVHCHAGNDRTGGVLTGYLCMAAGLTPRRALDHVRAANPDAISAEGYEEMILTILEDLVRTKGGEST